LCSQPHRVLYDCMGTTANVFQCAVTVIQQLHVVISRRLFAELQSLGSQDILRMHNDKRAQDALRSVSTAPSMLALRCRAATITSLCKSGKMPRSCDISASVGTRMPVEARSTLPVSSLTHSRMTDGPGCSAAPRGSSVVGRAERSVRGVWAVVITSSSSRSVVSDTSVAGKARVVRRTARVSPMSEDK